MIDFYILLKDKFCKISARTQADAQKRANREFKGQWSITTDKTATRGKEPVEFSPIEVSYEGYRPEDLPETQSGSRRQGKVTHDRIRSRNEEGSSPQSKDASGSDGDKEAKE